MQREAAIWAAGRFVRRPHRDPRLHSIGAAVYRTIAELDAEVIRSAEPLRFDELDRDAFTPIRPGGTFGHTLDCAWLRITGEVPRIDAADAAGTDAVLLLGLQGEGLVHDAAGDVLDAVTTVWQLGDLPHPGGRFREVRGASVSGRVEVYADVAYNGWLLYPYGRGVYEGARVAQRDATAHALYYDTLTLQVLSRATDDAALAAELRGALDRSWLRFRRGDLAGAREALAPALAAPSASAFEYSAIGHGHLDQAWLWPIRETKRKSARTYARQLNNVGAHPGYRYGTSQPQQLAWLRTEHPTLFARVQDAVAQQRFELQGSFWVETDTNMPGGESLVRQAIVGRRFLQEEFGLGDADLRLCWLPDTFGYSGALPQILKLSGMDWFQTIKLAWNTVTVFPHRTFRWAGIDGTEVLVHMPPEGDYNSRGAADGLLTGLAKYPERALETALLVFGSGDGGGGPGETHLEVTSREHSLRGLPRVTYRSASDFFRDLEQREIEPRHRGELYLEAHQGTYTTQAETKRLNRLSERRLHDAEALAAMLGIPSRDDLEPHWRDVLLHQFHDILPGSAIERVNREAREVYARVGVALDAYAEGLVGRLGAGAGGVEEDSASLVSIRRSAATRPAGGAATQPASLNLTSFRRTDAVRHEGRWYRADVDPYAAAALVPDDGTHPELAHTADTIGNDLLTLRFDEGGVIVSCLDAAGREHAGDGLNRLVLHRDPYQFPWDAWDIGRDYLQRTPRHLVPELVEHGVDGPTVWRRQLLRWRHGEVEQRIVLTAGDPLVRIETRVDWHEDHRMLRAEFRPTHVGDRVRCEIQFGHLERPMTERTDAERAQFEICAHKWVAVDDGETGFALLNDSKYGHRAKEGLLSLNLLRAPTFPDPVADRGTHRFTYAFRPFDATPDAVGADALDATRADAVVADAPRPAPLGLADVIADGYRLNNPLRVLPAGGVVDSVVSASDPGVVVETLKTSEDGEATIVRLYESLGRSTTTAVRVRLPHASGRATRVDLLERPLASGTAYDAAADTPDDTAVDLGAIRLHPFEIVTLRVERP